MPYNNEAHLLHIRIMTTMDRIWTFIENQIPLIRRTKLEEGDGVAFFKMVSVTQCEYMYILQEDVNMFIHNEYILDRLQTNLDDHISVCFVDLAGIEHFWLIK